MTTEADLFGRYLRLIRDLARLASADDTHEADLRQLLRWLDDDCRNLAVAGAQWFRCELSTQIEQEALRYSNPHKRGVFLAVLKHLEAEDVR